MTSQLVATVPSSAVHLFLTLSQLLKLPAKFHLCVRSYVLVFGSWSVLFSFAEVPFVHPWTNSVQEVCLNCSCFDARLPGHTSFSILWIRVFGSVRVFFPVKANLLGWIFGWLHPPSHCINRVSQTAWWFCCIFAFTLQHWKKFVFFWCFIRLKASPDSRFACARSKRCIALEVRWWLVRWIVLCEFERTRSERVWQLLVPETGIDNRCYESLCSTEKTRDLVLISKLFKKKRPNSVLKSGRTFMLHSERNRAEVGMNSRTWRLHQYDPQHEVRTRADWTDFRQASTGVSQRHTKQDILGLGRVPLPMLPWDSCYADTVETVVDENSGTKSVRTCVWSNCVRRHTLWSTPGSEKVSEPLFAPIRHPHFFVRVTYMNFIGCRFII